MATYINTDAAGRLTYEIQPEDARALFSNFAELSNTDIAKITADIAQSKADIETIFSDIETIVSDVSGEDVSASIALLPGVNCGSVTLTKAIKHSNVLYMQFSVAPSVRLSTAASIRVNVSGAAPAAGLDWRIILGATLTAHYHGFLTDLTENGCTIMLRKDNAVWELEETVNFSAIIPVS